MMGIIFVNDIVLRIEVKMIPDPNACYDQAQTQQSHKWINGPIRFRLCFAQDLALIRWANYLGL